MRETFAQRDRIYRGEFSQSADTKHQLAGLPPDHPNRFFPLGGIGAPDLLQGAYAEAAGSA